MSDMDDMLAARGRLPKGKPSGDPFDPMGQHVPPQRTTGPVDPLSLFDETGRQRSLPELAAASNALRKQKVEDIGRTYRPPLTTKQRMALGDTILHVFQGQVPGEPPGTVPGHLLDAFADNPDWDREDMLRYLDSNQHPMLDRLQQYIDETLGRIPPFGERGY